MFVNNSIKLSDKFNLATYSLDVTPADWTFLLAPFIYLWQGAWLTYGISMVCRRTQDGYMYVVFPVLPPILFIVFAFGLACNVAWLLIWDKQYMEVALIFICLMGCTLYICLVVSLRRLGDFGPYMAREKLTRDIWTLRLLVQNGLSFYAAWGSVASFFNFAIVLTYRTGLTADRQEVGSTVSLIIFSIAIFSWFLLDLFMFENALRYIFMPYITVIVSIIGILTKNWDPNKRNAIYTAALLGAAILLATIKFGMSMYRHYKEPIYGKRSQKYRRPMVSFEVRNLLEQ